MSAGATGGERPTIGVVIPTFNCRRVIMGAIDSLRAQTYPAVRIVVVDDGSTDDTAALLEPLATRGEITYLKLPNRGVSAARNSGIRAADFPLIAFLDADDALEPHALESLAAGLAAAPQASFAIADVLRVYPGREELRVGAPPPGDPLRAILQRNFVEGGGLFRRQALLEAGLFDETLRACEDWDLYIKLIARGFVPTYVPGASYRYIMRSDSITRNEKLLVSSYEKVIRTHLTLLARKGDPVYRRIFSDHLWRIARTYFYTLRMRSKALQCAFEAVLNDPVPPRLRPRPPATSGS